MDPEGGGGGGGTGWSFSYNSFVKLHNKIGEPQHDHVICIYGSDVWGIGTGQDVIGTGQDVWTRVILYLRERSGSLVECLT